MVEKTRRMSGYSESLLPGFHTSRQLRFASCWVSRCVVCSVATFACSHLWCIEVRVMVGTRKPGTLWEHSPSLSVQSCFFRL